MTCEQAYDQITQLDRHETPSPALVRHIAECSACRSLFVKLTRLQSAARITSSHAPRVPVAGEITAIPAHNGGGARTPEHPVAAIGQAAFTEQVMRAIHQAAASPHDLDPKLSLGGWAVGGAVIIAGFVVVQFNKVVDWLRGFFGPGIDVALAMILGIALTVYLLMLVGSNLRAVRRVWRRVAR